MHLQLEVVFWNLINVKFIEIIACYSTNNKI